MKLHNVAQEDALLNFQPSAQLLATYADVLVQAGLGNGNGIKDGDIVVVGYNDFNPRFTVALQQSIEKAGGIYKTDRGIDYSTQSAEIEALWEEADHRLRINSVTKKPITANQKTSTPVISKEGLERQFRNKLRPGPKKGWTSFTLAYFPTPHMAEVAGVSLEEFWEVIADACFLQEADPAAAMRKAMQSTRSAAAKLNELDIRRVQVRGPAAHLDIEFVAQSQFVASNGGNVPSFEIFRTPAASKTSGWIECPIPTLYKGTVLKNTRFEFNNGSCIAKAESGDETLQTLLEMPGMNRLGEFALTDKRLSRITSTLLGMTLFQENRAGTGHIALGEGYTKCFKGDDMPDRNQASDHLDFVFDGEFSVLAECSDGVTRTIFENGQFTFF